MMFNMFRLPRVLFAPDDGLTVDLDEPDFDYADAEEVTTPFGGSIDLSSELFDDGEDEVDDEDEGSSATTATSNEELAALQAKVDSLTNQATTNEAILEGLNRLGTAVGGQREQTPVQQPGESLEEFAKRMKDGAYYEDPVKSFQEVNQRVNGPIIQRMMQNNLALQQRMLRADPVRGKNFAKYQDEIEKELKNLPVQQKFEDPEVYDKAYQLVMSRHIDELVQEQVEARLAEAGVEDAPATKRKTTSKKVPFSASSNTQASANSTRKKPRDYTKYPQVMDLSKRRGVKLEDAFAYLRDNGLLKGVK